MSNELISLLMAYDDAYFNGDPLVTDSEYDQLKRKAFSIDPANEYFIKVGSSVRGGKVKLPYVMGSLNQLYEGELSDWLNKYNIRNTNMVISDKLDGVSCMLVYNAGQLSIAYSRGDGFEGADISRHIRAIPSVPHTLSGVDYLVVRAEVILRNDKFDALYATEYRNPRNMIAGAMNRKETDADILKNVEVIAYEIVSGTIDSIPNYNTKSKSHTLSKLKQLGFTVVNYDIVNSSTMSDEFLQTRFASRRNDSEYTLDGLVITVDNHSEVVNLSSSSSINPEHSVKYKVLDVNSVVETYVKDVHWEISKSGYLKPRVEILPVELFGTTVTYATGFNAKYISDNGIGPGAKVKITKSGMVIPYLIETVLKATPKLPDPAVVGAWKFNDNKVEAVLEDLDAPQIVFKQVLDFFETYKVDLLKEANLTHVWNYIPSKKYDDAIVDICDMTESEWNNILGVNGSRVFSSLRNRLGNSAPETFYGACKYMGIGFGVRRAKALLKGMKDVRSELLALSEQDIIEKDGFDTKTALSILNGIPLAVKLMDKLFKADVLNFVQEIQTDELQELNVVMTGFRDADLQRTIESMGGKVGSGVSKKTTHLLCMDTSSDSSKMQKAKQLGVCVMTPDEFKLKYKL